MSSLSLSLAVLLTSLAVLPPSLQAQPAEPVGAGEIVGRATVTDGGTIEIGAVRIRLSGIDAPEMGQSCSVKGNPYRCGQRAALALDELLGSRTVHCRRDGKDRYGRVLAHCRVGDTDVNGWLVENGWAIAYRRYSEEYVAAEDRAHKGHLGIWAGMIFDEPEAFRAAKRRDRALGDRRST